MADSEKEVVEYSEAQYAALLSLRGALSACQRLSLTPYLDEGVLYLYDKTKTSYPWKDKSLYVDDVEIEINEWYKEQ